VVAISISDGGTLLYDAQFYSTADADLIFRSLYAITPWKQEGSPGRPFPRLTAWYADPGLTYAYSGVVHRATPWTKSLLEIKDRLESAAGTTWNSLLLNLYRDGQDSIGFHADDEPELGEHPVIGSVSFGAVRRFILKHPITNEKREFELGHGSALIMAGTTQHHWRHGVPKTRKPVGPRINLTFRRIVGA
jgi:alkylated DNA repair dioxygenase AlkB